ncbi:MAG: glycosyltransferase, partial [Solirubrobacteraceae bacterium]
DGTRAALAEAGLLDDPRVEYERLDRNRGSAGGYGHAVRRAAAAGHDWIWLMDDDAEPRPDALARMLAAPPAQDPDTAALAAAVALPGGQIDLLHRGHLARFMHPAAAHEYRAGHHADLGFSSWTGLMVRGELARALAPPPEAFFSWGDDVEYTLRLRRHGRLRLVPEAVVVHKAQMGGARPTRRGRLWGRLLGAEYPSASWEDYWKQLYGIRNFVWIKRRRLGAPPLALAGLTAAYVVKSLLYDDHPLRRVPWIARFARAGWRGDFTGPTPEQWQAIAAR